MEAHYLQQIQAYIQSLPGSSTSAPINGITTRSTTQSVVTPRGYCGIAVSELSFFCTEDDLSALFAPFGPILNIRVRRAESGVSLMHGSVVLATEEKARAAIFAFNGKEFMGRNIKVQFAHEKGNAVNKRAEYAQIHFCFLSSINFPVTINEKAIRDFFVTLSAVQVVDINLKKYTRDPSNMRQTGYGFAYFNSMEDAFKVLGLIKGKVHYGITFDSHYCYNPEYLTKKMGSNTSPEHLNQPYQVQNEPQRQLHQLPHYPTSALSNTTQFPVYTVPSEYPSTLANPGPIIFQPQNQLGQSGYVVTPPAPSFHQDEIKKYNHLAYPLTAAPNVSYSPTVVANPFSDGNSVNSESKESNAEGSNSSMMHQTMFAEPNHISYWK